MTPPLGQLHPDEPLWKVRQRLADYEAQVHQFDHGRLDWVPQPKTLLQIMLDDDEAGKQQGNG